MSMGTMVARDAKRLCAAVITVLAVGFVARANTIAYWPMTPTQLGSGEYVVKCAVSASNDFSVRAQSLGGISFPDNDIGWVTPPHRDPSAASFIGSDECPKMMHMEAGGKHSNGSYYTPMQTGNGGVASALALCNDFTVEGFVRPAAITTTHYIFNNGYTPLTAGGWALALASDDATFCSFNMYIRPNTGVVPGVNLKLAKVFKDELVGKWAHVALVYNHRNAENQSEVRFYMNGRLCSRQMLSSPVSTSYSLPCALYFGGVTASGGYIFNGDVSCWRVSDEPLTNDRFLDYYHRTVAYWPMTLTESDGNRRYAPCSVSSDNNLSVRADDLGGIECMDSDIGWTTPPNPDPQASYFSGSADCPKMVSIGSGMKAADNSYRAPFFVTNNVALQRTLSLYNDFTVEGFCRFTTLPTTTNSTAYIVNNAYSGEVRIRNGWAMAVTGPDVDGNCRFWVYVRDGGNRTIGTVHQTELAGRWVHIAAAFRNSNDEQASEFTFYLNGVKRGSATLSNRVAEPYELTGGLELGGLKFDTALNVNADFGCWRVSCEALSPEDLLGYGFSCSTVKPILWYRGDTGVTLDEHDEVVGWRNLGSRGTSGDLVPANADVHPMTVDAQAFGGRGAVVFDCGTKGTGLQTSGSMNFGLKTHQGGSWFVVFKSTYPSSRSFGVFGVSDASRRFGANHYSHPSVNYMTYFMHNNSHRRPYNLDSIGNNTQMLSTSVFPEKNGDGEMMLTQVGWEQGVNLLDTVSPQTILDDIALRLAVGWCGWTDYGLVGEIAEIRLYNYPLTAAQRYLVECELCARYGLDFHCGAATLAGGTISGYDQNPAAMGGHQSWGIAAEVDQSLTSGALTASFVNEPADASLVYAANDGGEGLDRSWLLAAEDAARAVPLRLAFKGAAFTASRSVSLCRKGSDGRFDVLDVEPTIEGDVLAFQLPANWVNGVYKVQLRRGMVLVVR